VKHARVTKRAGQAGKTVEGQEQHTHHAHRRQYQARFWRYRALVTWEECLLALEEHTGMYVPFPYFPVAVGFLVGFDRAQEVSTLDGFQDWMSVRHDGSNLCFDSLALAEYTQRDDAYEYSRFMDVSFEEQVRAVRFMCGLLRQYRAEVQRV
jgi:hypothetical protein